MDPMTLLMLMLFMRRRRRDGDEDRDVDDMLLPLLLLGMSGQTGAPVMAAPPAAQPPTPAPGAYAPPAPVATVAPPAINSNMLLLLALFAGGDDFDLFRRHD